MLIPVETYSACDFPGRGAGTPFEPALEFMKGYNSETVQLVLRKKVLENIEKSVDDKKHAKFPSMQRVRFQTRVTLRIHQDCT